MIIHTNHPILASPPLLNVEIITCYIPLAREFISEINQDIKKCSLPPVNYKISGSELQVTSAGTVFLALT